MGNQHKRVQHKRVCRGSSHALDDRVDLVPPLCSFAFSSVEHHAMLDLYIWSWFIVRTYPSEVKAHVERILTLLYKPLPSGSAIATRTSCDIDFK